MPLRTNSLPSINNCSNGVKYNKSAFRPPLTLRKNTFQFDMGTKTMECLKKRE